MNIKLVEEDEDLSFQSALIVAGNKKAIVLNKRIRESGRKNFCIGHELGHHSLHADKPEHRCSIDDLEDTAPHPVNIEQEANKFAMDLLMPADDVRAQSSGRSFEIEAIELLKKRYDTSLTATALRVLDLAADSAALVMVRGGKVAWVRRSRSGFGGPMIPKGQVVPTLLDSARMQAADPKTWFAPKDLEGFSANLYQSVVNMPYYDQALVLLRTY